MVNVHLVIWKTSFLSIKMRKISVCGNLHEPNGWNFSALNGIRFHGEVVQWVRTNLVGICRRDASLSSQAANTERIRQHRVRHLLRASRIISPGSRVISLISTGVISPISNRVISPTPARITCPRRTVMLYSGVLSPGRITSLGLSFRGVFVKFERFVSAQRTSHGFRGVGCFRRVVAAHVEEFVVFAFSTVTRGHQWVVEQGTGTSRVGHSLRALLLLVEVIVDGNLVLVQKVLGEPESSVQDISHLQKGNVLFNDALNTFYGSGT